MFARIPLLKLNSQDKTLGAGEKFEDFETHFRINSVKDS
jgi:hypothetical protein